jgi:hypothetical protein
MNRYFEGYFFAQKKTFMELSYNARAHPCSPLRRVKHLSIKAWLTLAASQTISNTLSDIGRNQMPDHINLRTREGAIRADSSRNDRVVEAEEGLSGLLDTGVFITEAGNEDGLFASGVPFGVDGSLGEDDALELGRVVTDDGRAILGDELGVERALDDNVEFGGSRVNVGCVEAASVKESNLQKS